MGKQPEPTEQKSILSPTNADPEPSGIDTSLPGGGPSAFKPIDEKSAADVADPRSTGRGDDDNDNDANTKRRNPDA
jgi:hypothetical protein